MLRSDLRPDMKSSAVAPLMAMPTSATQMTVISATGSGLPRRCTASQTMAPTASSSSAGVGQRHQDRAALQPVGVARRRATLDQRRRAPRHHQAQNVAQIVAGVGQQGERVGDDAIGRLDDDEADIEGDADGKGAVVVRRPVAVRMTMGVAVRLAGRVIVVVVLVSRHGRETYRRPPPYTISSRVSLASGRRTALQPFARRLGALRCPMLRCRQQNGGNNEMPTLSPEQQLEAATMRRVSWRLMPFLLAAYLIAYIDRVNVGFAALQMNKAVGLDPKTYGLGAGIFFIGYFIFEVPSNLALQRFGARTWIARIMISWGIVSAAFALIGGPTSFLVLRFLLGVAEAGFFPGVILYFTYWYPARYRATIVGIFMVAIPVAGLIGSPISGAILYMDGILGLGGWQWIFLLEAAPAVLLGIAAFIWLTDKPEHATWLSARAAPVAHRQARRPKASARRASATHRCGA